MTGIHREGMIPSGPAICLPCINRAVANDFGLPQPKFVPHPSGGSNADLARLREGLGGEFAHWAVAPPSITSSLPVTKEASSEARYSTP